MEKKVINTEKAPGAIGPYSQGIKMGDLVFTSGQLPIDMESGELIVDDIKKATKASLENVKAILEEAGSSLDKVVKTVVYLRDINDFGAMNEIYGEYFNELQPARSCFQVAKLPKNAPIEIEVIAEV
ncbi:RidA family protein [Clostridium sp. ZS2-4]|uniref:RidA family protein n=1 Tax=Clostridium sp. ZS2-4 TaxID=2987703 RepID=UPI00227B7FE7|nr:RidA family protein [Clostridium sp. ZS2-4]MCY6354098.1 RidA family protein [Clostridium sp. ZS2-4]